MSCKNKADRAKYMREYRARKKETPIQTVQRKDGIVTTSALTLGQFLREDMGFHHMPLDEFIELAQSEGDPEGNKHITVYFLVPGFCVAIPDYA